MAIVCFPSPSFPEDSYPENYWTVAPSSDVAAAAVHKVRCLDDDHDWWLNPALIDGLAKMGR